MASPYYNAAGGSPVIVQGHVVASHASAPSYSPSPYNHSAAVVATDHVYSKNPQSNNFNTPTSFSRPQQVQSGCRDAFWGFLFYVHLGLMAVLAVYNGPQAFNDATTNYSSSSSSQYDGERRLDDNAAAANGDADDSGSSGTTGDITIDPAALLSVMAVAGIAGCIVSSLALGFMMHFAEGLIKMALFFNIAVFATVALLSLAVQAIPGAIMGGLGCAIAAYYAYCVWSRVPFAAANLVTAVTAVRANIGLALYAYISLLLLVVWSFCWTIASVSTVMVLGDCEAGGSCGAEVSGVVIFLFLISYYWTIQVITNVVHVTTAGTVGTFWFAPIEANGCCSSAVRDSYVRSLTTSFGSICFGSLIVAIIQAVKEVIHSMRENGDSFVACCAECLIGCLESLVEYFNRWAFVYVGLYGMSFMEAGSSVMNLFRSRGWTAIIADMMVDTVLMMVSFGVGAITALCAVIVGAAVSAGDASILVIAAVLGFILGYGMSATLFSVVSSAVNTVIVCYAEAPNEFQANHPKLSDQMRNAWRRAYPEEFGY